MEDRTEAGLIWSIEVFFRFNFLCLVLLFQFILYFIKKLPFYICLCYFSCLTVAFRLRSNSLACHILESRAAILSAKFTAVPALPRLISNMQFSAHPNICL